MSNPRWLRADNLQHAIQYSGKGIIITFGKTEHMKRAILASALLFILISVSAHPWKPRHYVIVDTDGGIDDQKALCMLLASPDVRVLGVTVSDGYHKSPEACKIVRTLLDSLWHEGLPLASGTENIRLIEECLDGETSPVTFISLGSLKTAAEAMESAPSFKKKVKQIIWSNEGLPGGEGFNYKTDPEAAKKVLEGPVPVRVIGGGDELLNDVFFIEISQAVQRMQAIKALPADTSFYMADLQPYVKEIYDSYGKDEWVSGVIANELHRHLGVFAIIGVKMGIRAREYFCTGVDEMSVTSHAGSTPPLSCMNDGLQVSTGATPGHGLLTVSTDTPFMPAADFTHKGRTIRITLKEELAGKVSSELKEINFVYGLDSDIYWELVRQNSIKYWLQFDRHSIFDIEVIK